MSHISKSGIFAMRATRFLIPFQSRGSPEVNQKFTGGEETRCVCSRVRKDPKGRLQPRLNRIVNQYLLDVLSALLWQRPHQPTHPERGL